ncbi:MAG: hypothetical protein M1401_07870 [Chloroflexi bacterium]|nr:hypothetical protein [Chloroflexota bacterium]
MDEAADKPYEVFAWGHGYVGARSTLPAAERLASGYEGARIIVYDRGDFRVVAELGLYAVARSGNR